MLGFAVGPAQARCRRPEYGERGGGMSLEDGARRGPVSADDRVYLEQRAEAHLELAANSTNVNVVKTHYRLANLYLDRLHAVTTTGEQEPSLFRHWQSR